jgi:hypothetical protein
MLIRYYFCALFDMVKRKLSRMATRPPNLISLCSRVNCILEGKLRRQFGNFSLPLGLSSYSEVVFCVHFRYYWSTGVFHMLLACVCVSSAPADEASCQ